MDRGESFLNEIADELLPKNQKQNQAQVRHSQVLVVTHGGFIGEFQNVCRKLEGRQPVYNNSAKNTAMYIIKFERNAKDGLKSKMLLENDNAHLMLKINPELSNEEEKK